MIAGGAAPEIELAVRLAEYAQSLSGVDQYCIRAFAEALEVIPYTLAENAGLNPIATVTELRNRHAQNDTNAGINVRKVFRHLFFFPWIECFFSCRALSQIFWKKMWFNHCSSRLVPFV